MGISEGASMAEHDERNAAVRVDPVTGPAALTPGDVDTFIKKINKFAGTSMSLEGRVSPKANVAAVILAGGHAERFGNPGGKQVYEFLGKPVLTWSAEAFDATPEVGHIVIVCPKERREEYCRHAIDPYPFVTPIDFADAGDIRQESAMSGIGAVPNKFELIAVHDGARPLVTVDLITHAINAVMGNIDADGAIVGHPSVDTLKVVDGRSIVGTPDRSMFWVAQTPQVFRADILRRAYTTAMYDGFVGTDDSSLVERIGGNILMLNGPRDNIKVTVPEDIGPVIAALTARVSAREEEE